MSENLNDNVDVITIAGRRFVAASATGMALLFLILGGAAVWVAYQNRAASTRRHEARLHPELVEPGVTEADTQLPAGAKPTEVKIGVYVDRVVELRMKEVGWTVDFYVWFNWQGDVLKPGEKFQIVDGWIESKEKEAEYTNGDQHYALYRVMVRITKPFDVSRFPCDDHLLTINIEIPSHPRHELIFVPDTESEISSRVVVPGYRIREVATVEKPHSYKSSRGDPRLSPGVKSTYSQFRFGIWITRPGFGYFFKMFNSLYVAVAIAMLVFFIKPTDVDPRFGLGVGALFAAVANSYIISSMIPDTGIMSLADVVNGMGILTILLTVAQSTVSLYLYDILDKKALSRLYDHTSFAVLAVGYGAINIALPLVSEL